jgi:tetratricopeptide (TPR) repeat protein
MKLRTIYLLGLMCIAPAAAAEDKADPEQLYQKAWYYEESLLDPGQAVTMYKSIESMFPKRRAIAAKALARAAGCYGKLGKEGLERATWTRLWKEYKDEAEKSPEIQNDLLRTLTTIDELLNGPPPNVAKVYEELVGKIPLNVISPIRDKKLEEARAKRQTEPMEAIDYLRFAILLSRQIKDDATAASAQSAIGDIWFELGAYPKAIRIYEDVRSAYGYQHSILAWNEMKIAEAYRMMPTPSKAIERYAELSSTYPNQKEQVLWAKLWMGDCHNRELDDSETAKAIWREVAESEDAKKLPRQQTIARILAGLENPPETFRRVGDEFDNDQAYFIAVACEMTGNDDAALAFMRLAENCSEGNDWPYTLVERYLAQKGIGTGRE